MQEQRALDKPVRQFHKESDLEGLLEASAEMARHNDYSLELLALNEHFALILAVSSGYPLLPPVEYNSNPVSNMHIMIRYRLQ